MCDGATKGSLSRADRVDMDILVILGDIRMGINHGLRYREPARHAKHLPLARGKVSDAERH